MFLDNLSISLLQICDAEHLSYEQASERCGCSSRHFGNIVRRKSSPSLTVLEQICKGFQQTPNDLMGIVSQKHQQLLTYRAPMSVVTVRFPRSAGDDVLLPVCPQCGSVLKWNPQAYCSSCGQCLSWEDFDETSAAFHL